MPSSNKIFPYYGTDMVRTCQGWSDAEFGCYFRLLIYQWAHGPIPADRIRLMRISPGTADPAIWRVVKPKFRVIEDELGVTWLINDRLEVVRNKKISIRVRNQNNGKKGGRPRKTNTPTP